MATRYAPRAPTNFRCLCDLTEVGLAIRTDLGDHVWRFGVRGHHAEDADHPHFVCLDCGAATCLPELPLRTACPIPAPEFPLHARTATEVTNVA